MRLIFPHFFGTHHPFIAFAVKIPTIREFTMADLNLNDHHQDVLINYMKYARYHRSQNLKCIGSSFKDVVDSRLLDDTYTAEEVQEMLNGLCKVVQADVESDMINFCHSNVLILKQLFKQAEKWHLRLQVDLSELENKEMLENIRSLENCELGGGVHDKAPPSPIKMRLRPLEDTGGSVPLLHMEIERLIEENTQLKKTLAEERNKLDTSQKQIETLRSNLITVEHKVENLKCQTESAPESSQLNEMESQLAEAQECLVSSKHEAFIASQLLKEELEAAQQKKLEVEAQLQLAEQELERKFSETAAYANMKQMLTKKNEKIKELRKLLDGNDKPIND